MSKNFVQDGKFLTLPAPSGGVVGGLGYLIGGIFGVATRTADAGVNVPFGTQGVWSLIKAASIAWAVGDRIFWDDENKRCSNLAGEGVFIGACAEVVSDSASATSGKVLLNGGVVAPLTESPSGLVNVTAATLAVTAAKHAGKLVKLNRAAGIAVTLPAASGTGNRYDFIVGTAFSGGSGTIKVTGDDIMTGLAINAADGGNTVNGWETAADTDTITLDGSTFGGVKGDRITLVDFAADTWSVQMTAQSTGAEASPFSATV